MLWVAVDVLCRRELLVVVCIGLMSLFEVVVGCCWCHVVGWLFAVFVGVGYFMSMFDVCSLLAVFLAWRY